MKEATAPGQRPVRVVARERIRSRPVQKDRTRAMLALMLVAVIAATAVYFVRESRRPAAVDTATEQEGLRVLMYMTVRGIEGHRNRTGLLPRTLEAVGLDDPTLTYELQDGGYVLTGQASDSETRVTYRSGEDLGLFEGAFHRMREAS